MLEWREITRGLRICDRSVMISSVRPSLKYSLPGSALWFSKGSTAIDFFASGVPSAASATVVEDASERVRSAACSPRADAYRGPGPCRGIA